MDSTTILFNSISQATGGFITDITTAMMGLLSISILVMGLCFIKKVFARDIQRDSISVSGEEYGFTRDEIKK